MKLGQIANKKVISTFVCSLCFLLVLYCTLSQVNLSKMNLKASISDVKLEKVEEALVDSVETVSKERGLSIVKYVTIDSFGDVVLQYSGLYYVSGTPLSQSRGALYFNGHKETYYSQRVLPGSGLSIPGRHVADDGTVRDGDGFISVAADPSYLSRGSIVMTSLGPAKVYDTGCAYGTVDIYVNW